jgi:hypothetical protein
LFSILTAAALLVGWWLVGRHGIEAWSAAAVAWGVCFLACLTALLLSVSFARTPHAMSVNLATMMIRMGVPLAAVVVVQQEFPALAERGAATAILILYLVGLATETVLAVRHVLPTGPALRSLTSSKALGA